MHAVRPDCPGIFREMEKEKIPAAPPLPYSGTRMKIDSKINYIIITVSSFRSSFVFKNTINIYILLVSVYNRLMNVSFFLFFNLFPCHRMSTISFFHKSNIQLDQGSVNFVVFNRWKLNIFFKNQNSLPCSCLWRSIVGTLVNWQSFSRFCFGRFVVIRSLSD